MLKFTTWQDSTNHVAMDNEENTIDVEVKILDSIITRAPALIKMDVEGFETEVLNGGQSTLEEHSLKAIIIELGGLGTRYGYDEKLIHNRLLNLGFSPYKYHPKKRKLTEIPCFGDNNTLYLRDIKFVVDRITNARKIKIGNNEL
jgi:hypothetical protein